jgi:luciferase family oxidoreductase group 1
MADFSPASVEITILIAGALIYAFIWFASRNLSRAAKILARVVPLGLVVPVMIYVSGTTSKQATAPYVERRAPPLPMILSVLDQSPIRSGGTAAQAIQETLQLAELADRLGYHRYWLAEHHSSAGLAGSAPEVLIGQVASRTSRIRVGSGGVMLSHYSALKVAENFRVLEALFPGRIDLGIGRAPGSDQRTARALRQGPGALGLEHFPQQLADLIAFLHDELPPNHPFTGVRAMPAGPTAPPLWILGSSGEGALLAAHFGTAFSYAHFINAEGGTEATRAYRESFRPSPRLAAPQASVAAFVICADTAPAPKDWPVMMTLPGSPPKMAILSRTHFSAAFWSR